MTDTEFLETSIGEKLHGWHATEVEWLRALNLARPAGWDTFFQFISDSVPYLTWFLPIFLIIIALVQKQSFWQIKSVYVGITVALASLLSFILKHVINRIRPFDAYDFLEKLSVGGSPSFPSGHTTAAFALSVSLIIAYPKWYIITPAILWAILAGYSRMSLGVHYPSDVFAGILLGVGTAVLVMRFYKTSSKNKAS